MARIGVFVCRCGRNIAATVDVAAVTEALADHPGVVHAEEYTYMCSDPGQLKLRDTIGELELSGVVVAACSPQLHETTFRLACHKAGLNPFLCEMANIREHCSWVHPVTEQATAKAIALTRMTVEKLKYNRELHPIRIPVNRRALVVGGGIAGIQAALDIARAGHEVVLVERAPHLGGHAARLAATFPTLESVRSVLRPKLAQLARSDKVWVLTSSEVVALDGHVGNFNASIRRRPSSPDRSGNVLCEELGVRPGADAAAQESTIEVEVGAVVPAIGYGLYPLSAVPEYGGGTMPDVITSFQFEEMLAASGGNGLRRPSDGRVPEEVVFVQCVRSRDREHGVPYCSRICCTYTAKQAIQYKQRVPDGQAYVFYIDIRAQGKDDEEFIRTAAEDHGVLYLRGRVSRLFAGGDQTVVWGADTLSGTHVEIAADLVVLAVAMTPSPGALDLARRLGIACDDHGFLSEAHPKLRPVETSTAGIFLAGTCQSPRDLAGTVAHASGAASKVVELFSSDIREREPEIARVDEACCAGCLSCAAVCPARAIAAKEIRNRRGDLVATVAAVNRGLCQGCGLCAATCTARAIDLEGCTDEQVFAALGGLLADDGVAPASGRRHG